MNVIIVEDEYPNAFRLQNMLTELDATIKVLQILDSVASAVKYLQTHKEVELIFLDIQLSDGLGMEILEHVSKEIPVIFTTAYDQYALETFKYLSVDYLLKPIKQTELQKSVEKYRKFFKQATKPDFPIDQLKALWHREEYTNSLICRIGKNLYPINVQEIAYFYFEERDTWVKSFTGKEYTLPKTLEKLEKELDPNIFFRANRKLICAKEAVLKFKIIEKSKINIALKQAPDFEVIVSSEKSASFKKWISE